MFNKVLFLFLLSFVFVLPTHAVFDANTFLYNIYAGQKLTDNADSDSTGRVINAQSTACQGANGGNIFRKESATQYWGSATQTLASITLEVQTNNDVCNWTLNVYDVNLGGSFLTNGLVATSDNVISGADMNDFTRHVWSFENSGVTLNEITAIGLRPESGCAAGTNNVNYRGTLYGMASSTGDAIQAYNFCKVPSDGHYNVYAGDPFIIVNTLLSTSSTITLNTVSSTCDFNNWETSVQIPRTYGSSTAASSSVLVAYAAIPDYEYIIAQDMFAGLHLGEFNVDVTKGQSLFNGGGYYVKAFICPFDRIQDCDVTSFVNRQFIEAESEWQYFEVDNLNCPNVPVPYMTSSTLNFDTIETPFCGVNSNIVVRGFCNVLTTVFYPSGSVMNKFEQLKDNVSVKPPFGYFTVYTNLWQQVGVSSTVVTSTPTQSWTDFSPVTTMRTAIGYLLWGLFGTYIIIRFKNFIF